MREMIPERPFGIFTSIMAHPSRHRMAMVLHRKLYAPIIWDELGDTWDTGRRALLRSTWNTKWTLVIQDDAVVPPGFLTAVENALVRVPEDSPLVLYCTRTSQWAQRLDVLPRDTSYLTMERIWWGVGVVVPTMQIPELVEYCDTMTGLQYDHRLGRYYSENQIPVYYTWPNLLNHRNTPSLVPGRTSRRRAHNYVQGNAAAVRWDGRVIHVTPPPGIEPP